MKQDLTNENGFNKSYERSMNHNYMILSKCNFFDTAVSNTDFRTRMLLENNIKGLLPVSLRQINGEDRYYYEINSLQAFDRLYDHKEMRYDQLKALLCGCADMFEHLEEYLLDGNQIIIKSDYIYINVETSEPYFVCYPEYTGDVRLSFMQFIDELLTKIDHTDQHAVMLGYQIYRYTRNPNFVISEIKNMLEHTIVNLAGNRPSIENSSKDIYKNTADCLVRNFGDNVQNSNKNINPNNSTDLNKASVSYKFPSNDLSIKSFNINNNSINNVSAKEDNIAGESEADQTANIDVQRKKKGKSDLIGFIFCIFVALAAVAIILGARILMLFKLSADQEMYLYGAIAMSVMAAVIFLVCYIKAKKHANIINELENSDDEYNLEDYNIGSYGSTNDFSANTGKTQKREDYLKNTSECDEPVSSFGNIGMGFNNYNKFSFNNASVSETICLNSGVIEERMLRGHINGNDINIPLNRLPMTVGKLEGAVDFTINDSAVSKLHARFEERGGRVFLSDLNSTNGTIRNGEALNINESVRLEPGDRIRFGRSCFTYC
ncbi:MAG: FHA domain-containing protein [Lachnospiraceae bacterium]|nr:FHA domain-containing protein [Lachnospiraceae bacterium]